MFQYEEVDAEQLQRVLNENILKGLAFKNSVKLNLNLLSHLHMAVWPWEPIP